MSIEKNFKPIVMALTATFAVSVAGGALASSSFQATSLSQGYQLVDDSSTATGSSGSCSGKTAQKTCNSTTSSSGTTTTPPKKHHKHHHKHSEKKCNGKTGSTASCSGKTSTTGPSAAASSN